MLDEIQTGMGRSGRMFAFQHENIVPDVMTLAKALGNGVPIGACVARGKAAELFHPGNHGSTFGGNPLACRVGYTVLDSMVKNDIAGNAERRGEQLVAALKNGLADIDVVEQIRHLGLLVGIELKQDCKALVSEALQQGLLVNVTADRVIRLLPPLIIDQQQTDELADQLIKCIHDFTQS